MTVFVGLQSATTGTPILPAILFYILAALTLTSAIAIVVTPQTVRMAVYLLATLAGVAGLYFLLDAEFLAAVQLVVYAGGTLILIVFSIMLTTRSPLNLTSVPVWERLLGSIIGLILGAAVFTAAFASPVPSLYSPLRTASTPGMADNSHVATLGRTLLSTYVVPFEVVGVLLLLVMVGASYLARRNVKPADASTAPNPTPRT